MRLARFLAVALLLAPAFAPVAEAAVTYTFQTLGSEPGLPVRSEFRVGETVVFRLAVSASEAVTITKSVRLYREGGYRGTVGDGSTVLVTAGPPSYVRIDWRTDTLSPVLDFGRWRAEWDTPTGVQVALFHLDYAPDFSFTALTVQHGPFPSPFPSTWSFLRDGGQKTVRGCVVNTGPEAATVVRAELYYRTPADFAFFGGTEHPRVVAPDYRNGRSIATQDVVLGYPNKLCRDPSVGVDADGWLVQFSWRVADHASGLGHAVTRIGLRADPAKTVWEMREDNNEREIESTIQPLAALP